VHWSDISREGIAASAVLPAEAESGKLATLTSASSSALAEDAHVRPPQLQILYCLGLSSTLLRILAAIHGALRTPDPYSSIRGIHSKCYPKYRSVTRSRFAIAFRDNRRIAKREYSSPKVHANPLEDAIDQSTIPGLLV
jgi:hypothetical protein